MAAVTGINANYDATAASQGVPITTRVDHHEEEEIVADTQHEPIKTHSSSSTTEGDEKSPAHTLGANEHEDKIEMERRSSVVQALARTYSKASGAPDGNPFLAGPDSPLNPSSPNFSGSEWAKAIVELVG